MPCGFKHGVVRKHPHVRGEDYIINFFHKLAIETPPRAWGRLTVCRKLNRFPRNTPTCVGKTGSVARFARSLKKHPHVRGEDLLHFSVRIQWMETPPRAWGRLSCHVLDQLLLRNTPTCVGKTRCNSILSISNWKHPHVRGEDFHAMSSINFY